MKTIRNLKCILSEDEIREAGAQMANAFKLLKADQDNLKSAQAEFKALIASHEGQVNLFANRIQSGFEYRDVQCHEEEFALTIQTIRDDTGEVIDTRDMTREEQQRKFDFEHEGGSGPEPAEEGRIIEAEFYIEGGKIKGIEFNPQEDDPGKER